MAARSTVHTGFSGTLVIEVDVTTYCPGCTTGTNGPLEFMAFCQVSNAWVRSALDADAVADALCALGRIATDLAGTVQSIDVNPFVALPRGGVALDALVVLRHDGHSAGQSKLRETRDG